MQRGWKLTRLAGFHSLADNGRVFFNLKLSRYPGIIGQL
jgi:hypothetical protein